MSLADLQNLFQRSVLAETPDPRLLALLRPPTRAETSADTFAVYHDGFRLRMAEFLAHDYPVLREALGEADFAALAEAYGRARPSTFRNARWFGAGLPDFLGATPPFSADVFVIGLARLEAALTKSFDAADEAELPIEILGATREEDWPRLRFAFHPGVAIIQTTAGARAAFEAFQAEAPLPETGGETQLTLLVWRRDLDVNYRALDETESLALGEARAGAPFGEICAALAFAEPGRASEEMAAVAGGFLARWFADGLIVAAAPAPHD